MPTPAKRGKLAYTFLRAFLAVSLIPMVAAGYYLVSISEESLRQESQRIQESLAVGFADTVWNYLTTYKNILLELAHLEEFSNPNPDAVGLERQNQYLNRIMQLHAAIMEVSVLDLQGQEMLRKGRFLGPDAPRRNFFSDPPFQVALQKGEYIGGLERFQGLYPTLTLSVPILDQKSQPSRALGVLMARVSMNGLTQMLTQEFPETGAAEAAVVSPDGFLIAHSRARIIFRPEAKLPTEITKVILSQTAEKGSGEIPLSDGTKLLGAFASVRDLGWVVYVAEPLESAYEAANEVRRKILWVFGGIIPIVILLSFAITEYVTHPIRVLREAADKLGRGQFDLPELPLTNDEIGDLAQTFLTMAESLKDKDFRLTSAKDKLEDMNKNLEQRVNVRTRELKAAQDELINKERLAAIGQMASVVGHEIRNPLAVISNSTYFIKAKLSADGAQVDPKISKHLSYIESEIRQANSIIDEILTFSRTRQLKLVPLNVNHFLEELLAVHPFPSHIQVVKNFDPRNPVANIDPEEMRQAVRNLIGNGVEVMSNGGTIKVATEQIFLGDSPWVRIDIGDSGPGIPPDVLEKIFNPFFTTKARGTGLGLAVVRKVVDRHQGKVDVETAVGKGTTFKLYLPLAAKSSVPGAASAQTQQPQQINPGLG